MHNHPSGDPTPFDQDLQFTEKVKQAVELIKRFIRVPQYEKIDQFARLLVTEKADSTWISATRNLLSQYVQNFYCILLILSLFSYEHPFILFQPVHGLFFCGTAIKLFSISLSSGWATPTMRKAVFSSIR